MRTRTRSAAVTALALALTATLTPAAQAAREPTPPTSPEDEPIVWLGEAATGQYAGEWERDDISVVERRWVVIAQDMVNGQGGTFRWFHTRGGSRFWIDFCDDEGRYLLRVSRSLFAQRTGDGQEFWEVEYDAERNRGTFTLERDLEMDGPCDVRERRRGDEIEIPEEWRT